MIYVTVGKGIDPFDRLVRAADALAAEVDEEVFIQTGCSSYKPVNAKHKEMLTFPEADGMLARASLVISHAGIGTIIGILRLGTPIIIVPRRLKLKEHFNDHQVEIAEAVRGRPGVEVLYETDGLKAAVERLKGLKGRIAPTSPGEGLIREIMEFIDGLKAPGHK